MIQFIEYESNTLLFNRFMAFPARKLIMLSIKLEPGIVVVKAISRKEGGLIMAPAAVRSTINNKLILMYIFMA